MDLHSLINIVYLLSAITFILGFKLMSHPESARRGNIISGVGMAAAIAVTLMVPEVVQYKNILIGIGVGSAIGLWFAYQTPMTGMPQMVGLLNGFGGLASWFVAWAEFVAHPHQTTLGGAVIFLTALIGAITFTGSLIAWAKLEERFISGKSITYRGQQYVLAVLIVLTLWAAFHFSVDTLAEGASHYFMFFSLLAFVLGVLLVIPIGGADMPVVICLLNSYSGMAACASGFIVQNNLLIVAGALVGASGIILTIIMCKAMNRSLANVFLGGFSAPVIATAAAEMSGELKPIVPEDAYILLEAADNVVIVPGYGMAVSQAQHLVKELTDLLEKNGTEVRFAIHPVAGRMPGHMNVLLAEAGISYDSMVEMDAINASMDSVGVCVIIGANDVVNPSAKEDKNSPLYGMPIIEAHRAKTVLVLKRGKGAGFSGVENSLFYKDNTRMLYGDAKSSLVALMATV